MPAFFLPAWSSYRRDLKMNSLRKTRCLASDIVDRLINLCKWPFAFIAVFWFPSSVLACWPSFLALFRSTSLLPFLVGIAGFWLVFKVFRKTTIWAWLFVLEHETVHLLFGFACFKIPKRWHVSSRGGHVGFDRGHNWLITISPYVFPLVPIMTFLCVQTLAAFLPLKSWVLPACMGFSMAVHIAFTWMESHYRQPDIQRVGGLFSILVAPTLHVIFVGVMLILSSSTTIPPLGPVSAFFKRIGQNGLVSWKVIANHAGEFIFSKGATEAPALAPSAKMQADPPDRTVSAPSGMRFERERRDRLQSQGDRVTNPVDPSVG